MLFAIWHHLCDLKNVEITHAEACNITKSNTPPWVFFTFFKLQKWYQIAQSVSVETSFSLFRYHKLKVLFYIINTRNELVYYQFVPLDIGRKLKEHEKFRRRPGLMSYIHFLFNFLFIYTYF